MHTRTNKTLRDLTLASRLVILLIGTVASGGCSHEPRLQRFHYAQIKMGVQVGLAVYAPDQPTAETACRAAFQRVEALENLMSDYRKDSELLRLGARAGGPAVQVSPELFFVLQKAQTLSRQTDGAFDVTVGPEIQLWRRARKNGQLPGREELEGARALTGWRMMRLSGADRTVRLEKPGMRLDLGGIAKGYAGDEAIRVLAGHGIKSALFEAGGDIVVSDPPPQARGWTIAIENANGAPEKLVLHNCAISTSGDTVQFVEIGGNRYSHVVDPRTGQALTNHYAATVVAPRGIDTDALSTALTVMGPEGMKLLPRYQAHGWLRKVEPARPISE